MTVRFYSSTDAGAPQADNNPGFLVSILRSCLVTGYGTRTPAGWSIAFEDLPNNKIAFQQGGSGRFLKVDHSANYQYAAVNGYDTMSDIDTGTEGMYDDNPENGMGYWATKAYSSGDCRWLVVADEKNVFFAHTYHSASGVVLHAAAGFCGDIEGVPGDSDYLFSMIANTKIAEARGTTQNFYGLCVLSGYDVQRRVIRPLSKLAGYGQFQVLEETVNGYMGARSDLAYPAPVMGGMLFRRLKLKCITTRGYLGDLPIFLEPINYYNSGNVAYPQTITLLDYGAKTVVLVGIEYGRRAWAFEVDVTDG